uniref:Polysaccharide biosynthesis enzyme WcbI domain-containing protein n=1 Tax=viral metagenome TaxID=1070528 RepID=A0A6C0KMT0_9ZZZZ
MVYYDVNYICDINSKSEICICDRKSNKNICLIGGCRITPFLNYLANDNYFDSYNILGILVFNNEMINLSKNIIDNEEKKKEIYNTTILICEYIINFDYFNTSPKTDKNIFKIKESFDIKILLPNYQDPCIYTADLILHKDNIQSDFINKYLNKAISLEEFSKILKDTKTNEIKRYYDIIFKSDLPELFDFVIKNIDNNRIAYTINHPSNILFIKMHEIILKKFFNREIPDNVLQINNNHEFLNSEISILTFYDKECLHFNINEEYLNEEESIKYLLKCISQKNRFFL